MNRALRETWEMHRIPIVTVGAVVLLLGLMVIFLGGEEEGGPAPTAWESVQGSQRTAARINWCIGAERTRFEDRLGEQLRVTEQREGALLEARLAVVDRYFDRARSGVKVYVDRVFSWSAIARLAGSKAASLARRCRGGAPWGLRTICAGLAKLLGPPKGFGRFVAREFERQVIAPKELERLVTTEAAHFAEGLRHFDDELVEAITDAYSPSNPGATATWSANYQAALRAALAERQAALEGSPEAKQRAGVLAKKIGGDMLLALVAMVTQRAAVGAILTVAGIGGSWVSLGLTLLFKRFTGRLIDWVLRKTAGDPKADVAKDARAQVRRLRGCVRDGCVVKQGERELVVVGLREWLETYRVIWDQLRRQALRRSLRQSCDLSFVGVGSGS